MQIDEHALKFFAGFAVSESGPLEFLERGQAANKSVLASKLRPIDLFKVSEEELERVEREIKEKKQ